MAEERVIVVGAGGISNAWFGPIKQEQLNVVAVVDLRLAAAQRAIEKYELSGAVASDDLDRTLRDHQAEFVIDLTIPEAHCDVTCKALQAGFHVIGEKPMAANMEQARRMVQTAERTGKLYMVSQSRRWDSHHETIRRTVAAGRIGQLSTLNCDFFLAPHFGGFRDEMDSPLILDMAIHHFDLARMFAGRNAVSVYCDEFNPAGSWYRGNASANCIFELEGGLRFVYRGSWAAEGCHTSWNGNWRLIGDKGTLLYAQDEAPTGQVVNPAAKPGFFRETQPLEIEHTHLEHTTMHGALREMLRFLRTGEKPQTECHDNIHSLAMVFAAIESARTGQRVKIEV